MYMKYAEGKKYKVDEEGVGKQRRWRKQIGKLRYLDSAGQKKNNYEISYKVFSDSADNISVYIILNNSFQGR